MINGKNLIKEIKGYRKLSESVYNNLRELIINKDLKDGERLLLNELAGSMNVSVTPLREALSKLEKEGLVISIPHKGCVVVSLNTDDIIEIYDIREGLETMAVRLICQKIEKSTLKKLENICGNSEKFIKKKDLYSYQKYNEEFHDLLIKTTQNKRLIKIMDELKGQLSVIISKTLPFSRRIIEYSNEHREIVKALKIRDSNAAENIMHKHIKTAKEDILEDIRTK